MRYKSYQMDVPSSDLQYCSVPGLDPEDLWDFGTVRHAATVGRSQPNPIQVSGPPLTWENDGTAAPEEPSPTSPSLARRGPSDSSSINTRDLPPLPPSAPGTPMKADQQATIRHPPGSLSREPSDEYDNDFEDPDAEAYQAPSAATARQPLADDELPDTTMLDSVVLPAIASVRHRFI